VTVAAIRERDRKRSEVLTDEGLRFVLYKAEIRKYHLTEGAEIPEEDLREIQQVLLPKRAKLRAMNLLQSRDYTESRLREKLTEGGYPPEVVDEAVAYVASYHYIDDGRYAADFVRARMGRHSRARVRMDLLSKGIDPDTADRALEEAYSDELLAAEDPEIALIRAAIRKKHFDPQTATWEEKQKFLAAMCRKGFSADKVREAFSTT
jgi:regulatory protein